ncbi:short-chain dehydrogenase [Chytriomyces sp. MP71]|nr:short-chain dehydrogenase [Chytriomyces sp. MP71]
MPQTVIVTGTSKGIGKACVQALLAHEGNHFVVGVGRSASGLTHDRFRYIQGDVCDPQTQDKMVAAALAFGQGIHGVVLNAATTSVDRMAEVNVDKLKSMFDVNLFSALSLSQKCLPHLRATSGRLIFVSSGAAVRAVPGIGPYCLTKATLNMLNMALAVEEPRVTCVAFTPGPVDTEMQAEMRTDAMREADAETYAMFMEFHEGGGLPGPDVAGGVLARLAMDAPRDLSGLFLTIKDERVKEFL